MTTPNDKADLRHKLHNDLKLAGVPKSHRQDIINYIYAHDQNLKASVLRALPEKRNGLDGFPPEAIKNLSSAAKASIQDMSIGGNEVLYQATQAINKVFEEEV